ncbi:MAG: NADH-quinone oxidoreductase subunit L [Tannerella sp.]|jgi:NADH-quinone oxidoreductase subunit L|nr:NADH-quinone oxidoreductase subunit L [Tannerella sp.]
MEYTVLILVLPFLSFLLLGLGGKSIRPRIAGMAGTAVLAVVTVLSYVAAFEYFGAGRGADGKFPTLMPYDMTWLPLNETLHIGVGILLDPISVMMLVVISTVSFMVHIYSLGYMKGEKGFQRYYAFLSLFTLSMTGLVVATNIFQTYIFWELVGVSSYLLIGFYYTKPAAVAASKKAFVVTRFADLGFLAGILIYGYYAGTFSFTPPMHVLAAAGGMIPLALGLMFVGGAGKSAMFPLHIWLPDAMEGPTPVSALIHAATMVVAGVYLVARMFPLFIGFAPDVLHWAGYVGAFTSLFAAVIACVQTDIKRVLAFSTISQIGFMIVALGVCTSDNPHAGGLGYMASMFHLFTHAMFKALLFLCAGAIIHAVHSNEMKDMGGLWKCMPVTHLTFLVACLAIAGIPPFSGFFSKDEILAACFGFSPVTGTVMLLTAGLTAFYMFRLYYNVFLKPARTVGEAPQATTQVAGRSSALQAAGYDDTAPSSVPQTAGFAAAPCPAPQTVALDAAAPHAASHNAAPRPHEAPASMTVPLIFLAAVTCVAGFIPFGAFVSSNGEMYHAHLDMTVAVASVCVAVAAIGIAIVMYKGGKRTPALRRKGLYRAVYGRFYVDEVYQFVTHRIIFNCISTPVAWFDRHVVDGFMNLLAWVTHAAGHRIKGLQSGAVQQYSIVFLSGALALIIILLLI